MEEAIAYGLQKLQYANIRENQKKVVEGYLSGKDVFFCAPTGSGKSLTFEIAPFVQSFKQDSCSLPSVCCIVVSPLVSLMKSQEKKLQPLGVNALYLTDTKSTEASNWVDILKGSYNILLCSPESILGHYRNLISELSKIKQLGSVFIDEAHCIRKFGQISTVTKEPAFRPQYRRLGELRSLAGPDSPVIALTATASLETQTIIKKCLCLTDCLDVIDSPNKLNIRYAIQPLQSDDVRNNFSWLINLLQENGKYSPRIIVFFRKVDHMATVFKHVTNALGDNSYVRSDSGNKCRLVDMFHMKTPDQVKDYICSSFQEKDSNLRVVLCTTSFSMGLDVKGVEIVVHYGPSNNLEDCLQETGRAGRDPNENCHAIIVRYKRSTGSRNITAPMKEYISTTKCRRKKLLQSFTKDEHIILPKFKHNCCDLCFRSCKCLCTCEGICQCETVCDYQNNTVQRFMLKSVVDESSSSDTESATGFSTDSDFDGYR